jgi:hexosaminidase
MCIETCTSQLSLTPYPQQITLRNGSLIPAKTLVFFYEQKSLELQRIAEVCCTDLEELGFHVDQNIMSTDDTCAIHLAIQDHHSLGEEGYRLEVDSAIAISSATIDGVFWGTRTLLQLLRNGPDHAIPQLSITDRPEFEYRGLMVDNARQFHSMEFHLTTIKKLASFKLNRYHIHFSDHQSYTLPSAAFPELSTPHRHYTVDQIRQLVEVANDYHVMIVPEVDVPGHSRALTQSLELLACDGEPEGSTARKICIGKEETYEILEVVFSEIMDMIPGEYWHLGADEVTYADPDGCTCSACLNRMDSEKFTKGYQLYHYFINRMSAFLRRNGRQVLVWEGFYPNGIPEISKEILVCPFDITHEGRMPKDYFDSGYRVLNTSWTPLYIANKIYMTTPEIMARWSPYMFGAGRSPQPFAYWKKLDPNEYEGRIVGAQMCTWDLEEKAEAGLLFGTEPGYPDYGRPGPRLQIMAERTWTGSRTSIENLLERVGAHYW